MKEKPPTVEGKITESLPNYQFLVELENESIIRAYVSGKMKLYKIKIMIGDRVELFIPEQGEIARITRRK